MVKLMIFLLNFLVINCSITETASKITYKKISPEFDKKGYPTTTTIKSLITAHYLQKNNLNKLSVEQINGGKYSERLYVAKAQKNGQTLPLLFFKISKKSDSTQKLIKIQEGQIGEKFKNLDTSKKSLAAQNSKNIPLIIWLENVYAYQDRDGKQRTIEVTPAAQGELVQHILDSENKSMIDKAGHALGTNLAAFQQLFINYNNSDNPNEWITVCHGDFSIKNSLYNPIFNKIYFIDNESMKNGSITQDVQTILVSLLMFEYLNNHFSIRWPLYLGYCKSFLKGYIESYPVEHRKQIALTIEQSLQADIHKKLHTKIINHKTLHNTKFKEKEFNQIMHSYLSKF